MSTAHVPAGYSPEHAAKVTSPFASTANHDLQRKSALIKHGPVNHGKNVFLVPNPDFDLNKTIFGNISGKFGLKRLIMKARLGNEPCWKVDFKERVEKEFAELEEKHHEELGFVKTDVDLEVVRQDEKAIARLDPGLRNNLEILEFMENDCNFKCEHADGSFMDHLHFCHDYGALYYKKHSPRVLFLHSIMGVGTNFFPMELDKVDRLKGLISPIEYKHVEAFPSVLRLINQKKLTDELLAKKDSWGKIKSIEMHRVLDNEMISLNRDELIVALNYQMVHQLDFLPSTNWKSQLSDPLFQVFVELYTLLTSANELHAVMDFNAKNPAELDEFGDPMTIANLVSKVVPKSLKRREAIQSIEDYSKKIGHSLEYKIIWSHEGKL